MEALLLQLYVFIGIFCAAFSASVVFLLLRLVRGADTHFPTIGVQMGVLFFVSFGFLGVVATMFRSSLQLALWIACIGGLVHLLSVLQIFKAHRS